jgi:carbonic anhydrase/acetyltransferase-like protein (isoleucine patch superfamily)
VETIIGANVTIGHGAMLEGCVVEDGAVVSMGAIVLQRARIGRGALVAAGSVVREGQEIPAGVVAAGVPAEVKKDVDGSSRRWIESAAVEYRELRRRYLEELTVREETRW